VEVRDVIANILQGISIFIKLFRVMELAVKLNKL
jgi:hypothetical protein